MEPGWQGTWDSHTFPPPWTTCLLEAPVHRHSPPSYGVPFSPPPSPISNTLIPPRKGHFRVALAHLCSEMQVAAGRIGYVNRANNNFIIHLAPFVSILLP